MPDDKKIKISLDDIRDPSVDKELQRQRLEAPGQVSASMHEDNVLPPRREYGRVAAAPAAAPSWGLLYSAVFYTSLAGLAAAILAWLINEYGLQEALSGDASTSPTVQAALFFAVVGAVLGAGLCSVEGIVSRNFQSALASGIIGLLLGFGGGALAGGFGQAIYALGGADKQYVVMALDTSASMKGQPLLELKDSSRRFVSTANPKTCSVGVVTFSTRANVVSDLSGDTAPILPGVGRIEASGETNMAEGIKSAREMLDSKQGRRVILLFSDGMPTVTEGMDVARLLNAELQKRGMSEVDVITEQLRKSGLTLAALAQVPDDRRNELLMMMLIDFLDESGILRKMREEAGAAALKEARAAREAGIEVIAIGTGEADRSFLGQIAGRQGAVLFAASGEISKAFDAAQKLIFKESSATAELSVPSVILRALSWAFVGALLASGQGIATRSGKRMRNGAIGGLLGGLVGGLLFDPLSLWLQRGWASRLVAIGVIGIVTGGLIGLVENLLKDAWLKVLAGHLAGKEFVIYRNPTRLGSSPKSDIYLFKDAAVAPQHAVISSDGRSYFIEDLGTQSGTFVNGARISRQRLRPNDTLQIGTSRLLYSERVARRSSVAGT